MTAPNTTDVLAAIREGRAGRLIPELLHQARLNPSSVVAQVLLARALEADNRNVDALRAWRAAAILLPNSPEIVEGIRRNLSGAGEISSRMPIHEVRPESGVSDPVPAVVAPTPSEVETDVWNDKDEDLDRLIHTLQSAKRIVPVPDENEIEEVPLEDESEGMASETLARIYATQEHWEEAARVYEQLAAQEPKSESLYLRRAAEMRARIRR